MSGFIIGIVSFFAGLLSSLGLGGGGVLLVYLTAYAGMEQLASQGINLLFFLPIGAVALYFHTKNKLVNWKAALWNIGFGVVGVFLGTSLAYYLGSNLLQKLFALLVLIIGLKELFAKKEV